MKALIYTFIATFFIACSSQKQVLSPNIKQQIDEQRYTFVAKSVFPTEDARYNIRNMFPNAAQNLYQLTSRYDIKVTPDSVIVYLPFFGRSYTAPMNPSEGGIKFTSTNFRYNSTIRKGNYEISIYPQDNRDVNNLSLSISNNGYGTLRVISNQKSPISFYGEIEPN